ncbi:WecB/TagA/CpsF family glycosyltransferase [Alkalinema sp. FACHB-956]|uniref:WecB/TagA/CpsF family glycosyltransferase n=1 Tax=Alkalinema sp. FACHB-956 TaxID=2692768 RepID=UPI0016826127|nr:WecB/TagA/CpsF family glycosyltransferase [Alkalinema sp. FACHB-956]MBD2328094.1 WecB/TagA/CpsF family glycosyltransferase [Alkalinema sp. FACHB-956]
MLQSSRPSSALAKQHSAELDNSLEIQDSQASTTHSHVTILNVNIHNLTFDDFLKQLQCGVVFTPNVDHIMKLQRDPEFFRTYQLADYRICDSQILIYASKFLGTPIQEKISGSDLLPIFCRYHRDNEEIKIFLLGGGKGVAQGAQQKLNQKARRSIVVAAHTPSFGFEQNEAECLEIVDRINQSQANVLVVGVGAPKQEFWIVKYRDQLPNIDIFLGLGGAIDFVAGAKPRSPEWISEVGLEWLYRLISEPRRLWKRYLIDDLPFLGLLLLQKLKLYRSPFKPQWFRP